MTPLAHNPRDTQVAVISGGRSAERDVSLGSGANIAAALVRRGYQVKPVILKENEQAGAVVAALTPPPDIAFNALHGRYGEDGCIQGILEWLDIPYTHSGVLASALAMDKPRAKDLLVHAGIPCPPHMVLTGKDLDRGDPMPRPYVIKPVDEGSSVGVHIIDDGTPPPEPVAATTRIMVEAYVPGCELTVAVLDGEALGVLEIRPRQGFYDYRAKYTDVAEHIIPAPIPKHVEERALAYAAQAHEVLGCRGASRADFRYDADGAGLLLLEVNTQPGMTDASLLPEIAAWRGINYDDLVVRLLNSARCGP